MLGYLLRRLLLIPPTLLGIMLLNFAIAQAAPGGPIDVLMARAEGAALSATARIGGEGMGEVSSQNTGNADGYRGARGLDEQVRAELVQRFGFDKPLHERFLKMMGAYIRFDFGNSLFQDRPVLDLVLEKMPVSISLGLWTTLLTYLICIPLGVRKAARDGSRFDNWTSALIIIGYAIPSFLFAILLIVVFAGGSYLDWFPLRGLVSDNWQELNLSQKIVDYFWHLALPLFALLLGGFATLTMLTKNSFLDEMGKQYVLTARAKGLSEGRVMYGHVFRNAMLIVIAGLPGALISILFTGALLIEVIFSLDGLGLLGFEAVINRDYPVVFATVYAFSLLGLIVNIISDFTYVLVDPRIDFDGRG